MSVLVVGAGIIGSSISRCLVARGAKVTVLEAAPAPAAGATGKSWAWLNANAKEPAHYRDLNLRSMQLWQQDHPDLCSFCGCLMLHDERQPATSNDNAQPADQSSSYPSQHIPAGPELQGLVPVLNPTLAETCQHAKLYAQEGFCEPAEATSAFLADAVRSGAHVLYGQQVERIATHNGRATVVTTTTSSSSSQPTPQESQQQQEEHSADVVVLAAGVGTSQLCAQLGYTLPLLHKPAAIVLTSPLPPGLLKQMLVTDTVFILQRPDGRFLIGETQPSDSANTDTSPANAARILQLAAAAVPALSAVSDLSTHVGYRPYPADGYPCVGWVPGCSNAYVAVTHSGMTLAPLIGQLVAEEVIDALHTSTVHGGTGVTGNTGSSGTGRARFTKQEVAQLLAPYRPDRDFEAAVAKAAAQESKTSWAEMLRPSRQPSK